MSFVVQNLETNKYLIKRNGPINLTVSNLKDATIFTSKEIANTEASNFKPYKLIAV